MELDKDEMYHQDNLMYLYTCWKCTKQIKRILITRKVKQTFYKKKIEPLFTTNTLLIWRPEKLFINKNVLYDGV